MDQDIAVGAIILGALAVFGYARMFFTGRKNKRLKELLPAAMIIDVRSSADFKAGHFPGAVNMPVDRIAKSAGRMGNKSSAKILYGQTGAHARRAARMMKLMGFSSVHVGGSQQQLEKLAE